jgi:hypothetical protein
MLLTHVDLIEKLYVQALLPSHPFSSTHASSVGMAQAQLQHVRADDTRKLRDLIHE